MSFEDPPGRAMLSEGAASVDISGALEELARAGYARLGRVLCDEGLTALRARSEALMLGQVRYPGLFFQLDAESGKYEDAPLGLGWQGPSLEYRKLEKLELDPLFRAWLSNALFGRVVRARIDGDIALYRAILFNKGPRGGSDVPWHQDGGRLWGLSRDPELQIWTALDDAPAGGGCLEFVAGSHLAGLATPLGGVVPPDQVATARANERALAVPVLAGEALLIDNRVWHRSSRGRVGYRRRAFSACYMSASTRCLRTRRSPRTFPRVVFDV